jgi:transcriptional regulator with XRE-family HTH domain
MPNRHRTTEELAFNRTVGNNIKYIRKLNNFTQARVGKALSCTFQQVQKFEKGTNGVSALKLAALAKLFKMKTDVIIDPNFIEYHRGFTAKAEAQEMQSEIINNQETPCQS